MLTKPKPNDQPDTSEVAKAQAKIIEQAVRMAREADEYRRKAATERPKTCWQWFVDSIAV